MLKGAFGQAAGDSSSGFSGTLEPADRAARRHDIIKAVWDCIESLPYHQMKPDPTRASCGYCLAQAGRRYLVYQESRCAFSVKTEGGPFRATWINGQNPTDRRDGGVVTGTDFQTPPDGDDWLLVLEAALGR